MHDIATPHDTFFRESFGRREIARDFLRVQLPAALAPYVPSFSYQLVDLSERTDAQIKGAVLTRLVQLALRWIFSDEPIIAAYYARLEPSDSPTGDAAAR